MVMRSVVLLYVLGTARGQQGDDCVPQGFAAGLDGVTLDFLSATIDVNNMGNYGPDYFREPWIRYNGIGYDYFNEQAFDLMVANTSYYKPNKVIRNGYTFAGDFGQINLADDETCDFKYTFIEEGTDFPFRVQRDYEFCLFDFDVGDRVEATGLYGLVEAVEVCQAGLIWRTSSSDNVGGAGTTDGRVQTNVLETNLGNDCWRFEATQRGYGSDNPERPDQVLRPYETMTPFVKEFVAGKFVCFLFPRDGDGFEVTYSVAPSAEPGFSGRNFLFSGNTANTLEIFYIPCYHCPDPEASPPEPVTGQCMGCGGFNSVISCDVNRRNSWDNRRVEMWSPDCTKQQAAYCSPALPAEFRDPTGEVTYPECMGPPLNCAARCNDQADTCFPPPPPPPPPTEYVCVKYECQSCTDAAPGSDLYLECNEVNDAIKYPDMDACNSGAYGGLGCDPIVCMVEDQKCKHCSALPDATESAIYDLTPTGSTCPQNRNRANPVPGYDTEGLCYSDKDSPCGAEPEWVCIVETGKCEMCDELEAKYDICTILGGSESPETPCKCPDYCLPPPETSPQFCEEECASEACASDQCAVGFCAEECGACAPIADTSGPGCTALLEAACARNCGSCAGCTGGSKCATCQACKHETQTECDLTCGSDPPPPPPPKPEPKPVPVPKDCSGDGDDDDDDGCGDDDDDDKKTVKIASVSAAEVASKAAEVAAEAAQHSTRMAQAAEAAEMQAAKTAQIAAQVLERAAQAQADATAAAAAAKTLPPHDQAGAAAGIDAPQLTLTEAASPSKVVAGKPRAQPASSSPMVLLSVVFMAGILSLAAVHAVLRAKQPHSKLPGSPDP